MKPREYSQLSAIAMFHLNGEGCTKLRSTEAYLAYGPPRDEMMSATAVRPINAVAAQPEAAYRARRRFKTGATGSGRLE